MQRQPGGNRQFREWSNITAQCTEVLWNQVRPTLPTKKKTNAKEGTVVVLGEQLIPEKHKLILQRGPKFCFEPVLNRVEKLRISRSVSRQVPEEEKPRCIAECVDVMASTEEFLWQQTRLTLPKKQKRGGPRQLRVATLGDVVLPPNIKSALDKGPKFSEEPKLRPVAKLALFKRINNPQPDMKQCSTKHRTKYAECAVGVVYEIPLTCGSVYIGQIEGPSGTGGRNFDHLLQLATFAPLTNRSIWLDLVIFRS
ncbi:hypothetical protein HPB47_010677 [Ixodes persulcatus]|uniref:Uncharacterized protein n=1 Tax=Ixodes persulcatus TaxID=34615 RepID=A0AC60NYN9_IXOPE|nr:hypothetical protein HPB47_010677 [Ixodes persulcatus]